MPIRLDSYALWGLVAATVAYVFFCWLIVSPTDVTYVIRSLQVSSCFGAFVAYWQIGCDAYRVRKPSRYELAASAWSMFFLATAINGAWLLTWRLADHPYWYVNNSVYSYFVYLQVVSATVLILTPGALDGVVPRENQIIIGVVAALAMLLLMTVLVVKPDLARYVEYLRPLIE